LGGRIVGELAIDAQFDPLTSAKSALSWTTTGNARHCPCVMS